MKLSGVSAKLTCMKSKAVRVLAAATLAGAVLTLAAPAAEAQHFAVGVQIGGSRYIAPAPVYYGPGYFERRRFEEREAWLRQQEFLRHERFDRDHRFHDDHDRFDRDHR
jgi:hypothetical protein